MKMQIGQDYKSNSPNLQTNIAHITFQNRLFCFAYICRQHSFVCYMK